jgi:hypothetical protein
MKTTGRFSLRACLRAAAAALALLFIAAPALAQTNQPVKVTETTETFTMDNGIIRAVVSKRTGDLVSMVYKGTETITPDVGGHSAAYWSHDTSGGKDTITRVSVDPARNGGERAEVSVKGISGGNKMGHGPGTAVDGDIPLEPRARRERRLYLRGLHPPGRVRHGDHGRGADRRGARPLFRRHLCG